MHDETLDPDAILAVGLAAKQRGQCQACESRAKAYSYKAARMYVEAKNLRFVVGSSTAQSFPPSSMQVGIRDSAAAVATFCPTCSLPMTIAQSRRSASRERYHNEHARLTGNMLDKRVFGDDVRVFRITADQLTDKSSRLANDDAHSSIKFTWTASGSMLTAMSVALRASTIHFELQ